MPLNRRSNRIVPASTLQQIREEAIANSERLQRERAAIEAAIATTLDTPSGNPAGLVDMIEETPSIPTPTETTVTERDIREVFETTDPPTWTTFGGARIVTGNPMVEKQEGFNKDTMVTTVTGKNIKYSELYFIATGIKLLKKPTKQKTKQ